MQPHQKENYGSEVDGDSQKRKGEIQKQSRQAAGIIFQFLTFAEFRKSQLGYLDDYQQTTAPAIRRIVTTRARVCADS
jgi:hypothetical protein